MGWVGAINAANELIKGRQQANELRDQAEGVQQKIDLAEKNREIQGQQYSAREEALRRNIRSSLGRQRAAIAESGTGFGGSNLQVAKQSEAAGELDALNLRYQGQLERIGLNVDIANLHQNKTNLRSAARAAMRLRWHNAAAAFWGAGTVNASQPTVSPGSYGQGSMGSFGNNVGNFTSGSGGGYTGSGLSGGYGSVGGYSGIFGGGGGG